MGGRTCLASHFVAVVLVFEGNIIYLGNIDTMAQRHTADVLNKGLCTLLNENLTADLQDKLVAIVSDSAAVMVRTKNMFIEDHSKVLSIPCILHILNLISKEMIEHSSIEKYVTGTKKIASCFRATFNDTQNGRVNGKKLTGELREILCDDL